ncbi:MAG: hypothetical protein JWN14_3222 [Chthonomonadales bacterium]|nr:hypothetical protein [Chthonomonadales bacterium]
MHPESDSANLSTFPVFRHPAPPQTLAAWDPLLVKLWSADRTIAAQTATILYPHEPTDFEPTPRESEAILWFLQQLNAQYPHLPSTEEARYQAVVVTVWRLLHRVRETPAQPFIEDSLAVALRPLGRLQAGALTPEICATLYDYHRGVWTPHLTRPQRQKIQSLLAVALASLPPDEMEVFWDNLHSSNALMRGAMCLGLEWLTSDHAVPHLLCGLDRSADSATRFAIVDNLARIGDPRALPRLYTLRRTSALTDWPLSRRISAAIGVIEHLNRGQSQRSLLRPAQAPPPDPTTLLRPLTETDFETATLLRPPDSPSSL